VVLNHYMVHKRMKVPKFPTKNPEPFLRASGKGRRRDYLPEIVVEGEALSTHFAGVSLLCGRVDAVVLLEGIGRNETLAAGGASERTLPCVLTNVDVQQGAVVEALTTRGALVPRRSSRLLVTQRHVALQSTLRLASNATLRARMRTGVLDEPVVPQVPL
jgi:hypothetical protein